MKRRFVSCASPRVRVVNSVSVVASLLAAGAPAIAQEGAEDRASGGTLEEVIVTAQFRQENLQDTPIAITAVNAAMLEARSQTNVVEIASQAPNVSLRPGGVGFGPSIVAFIRGVGQTDFIYAVEPGVGMYVDDVYYSTLTGSLLDLLDLDRVEVLRGPQGTLAGRNSIGGAIKLYSKPVGADDGSLSVTYGTLNRTEARGSGDFTLVPERLHARVAGATKHRDGYIDVLDYGCLNPGSGVPINRGANGCKLDEFGDQSYSAARVSLLWTPSDAVDVNLIADAVDDNSGHAAGTLTYGDNPSPFLTIDDGNPATPPVGFTNHRFVPYGRYRPANAPVNDPYVSYATIADSNPNLQNVPWKPLVLPSKNTLDMWGASAKIDWRISDTLALTSITAYRYYESFFTQDSDQSPISVTTLSNRLEHEQTSQELRLNGTSGPVDWTVGAFYFDQESFYEARVDLNYVGTAASPFPLDFVHGPDPTPATTWAVFAHTNWHITDQLNLSTGIRYSDEKKDYQHQRHNPNGTVPGFAPPAPNFQVGPVNGLVDHFTDERFDWRVSMDYRWTDGFMTYATVSTGYKGGGVNPRPFFPEQRDSFEPETLTAYELGFKSTLLDQRMRLNGAIFYNDYQDIQLNLSSCERPSPPFPTNFGPPCAKPANVGAAEVKGAELEVEFYPTDALSMDASISYLDFEYTEITGGALTGSPIAPLDMVTPYTPEVKASAGIQLRLAETSAGSFYVRFDGSYTDDVYASPVNGPFNLISGYTLTNGRLMWRGADDVWEGALEVTNLSDKLYYLTIFDQQSTSGMVFAQPGMPRQWAVTLKRNF